LKERKEILDMAWTINSVNLRIPPVSEEHISFVLKLYIYT